MNIAVITGASSGLGREFARQIDELGEVEQIWLIARRRDRLEEVSRLLATQSKILCADLSDRSGVIALEEALAGAAPVIRYLVNAAGFGRFGSFRDIPLEEIDRMIDLNCKGAVDVTQICLPYCTRGSRILEICSTAAFQPIQFLNVYAASKSFLYRYSRALNAELMHEGITVTAVCPYWVKDTEFIPAAEQGTVKQQTADRQTFAQPQAAEQQTSAQPHTAVKEPSAEQKPGTATVNTKPNAPVVKHYYLAQTSEETVHRALADARIGLSVSTPGMICTIHRIAAKILSSNILMALWELIRRA